MPAKRDGAQRETLTWIYSLGNTIVVVVTLFAA